MANGQMTRKPTAASVSRALAKAGFERSRWLRSGRVKGWGHSTAGFRVESEFDHPETIHIRHIFGDWHRGETSALPYLEKYEAALRVLGYHGGDHGGQFGLGQPSTVHDPAHRGQGRRWSMRNTRVAGHGLQFEGRTAEAYLPPDIGWRLTDEPNGQAVCECGAWSPELPSTAARKRWHAQHKADLLEAARAKEPPEHPSKVFCPACERYH
jgi:hypothetical protein